MTVSRPRRVGQIVTGLGALVLLVGLVGGAPIALLAFAGNPLPDHVPTFAEIGTALTSRDDGQLFVRTLAVVGWLGWGTFAMSVLIDLPFRLVRRPAPRLPGLRRQQRMAAALIGSALILIGSPATSAIAATSQPVVLHVPARAATASSLVAATPWASAPERATTTVPVATPASPVGVAQLLPAAAHRHNDADDEPRYQVERGDYLGAIADRYVGDFGDYPELARLNKIQNPDRIYPGQLLKLPDEALDHGYRPHASGMVIQPGINDGHDPTKPPPNQPNQPAPTQPTPNQPAPNQPAPDQPAPSQPKPSQPKPSEPTPNQPAPIQPARPAPPNVTTVPPVLPAPRPAVVVPLPPASPDQNMAAGAPSPTDSVLQINRPLAVSAVIAAAAIVGAQVGTVFGLRRRPAGTPVDGGRHRAGDE